MGQHETRNIKLSYHFIDKLYDIILYLQRFCAKLNINVKFSTDHH